MPSVLHPDPFNAVLLSSEPSVVSEEQKDYIQRILAIACSDSFFADKAYRAITHILTGGTVVIPVVSSLTPNTVMLGEPSFDIHVMGTGFTPTSVIVFAGNEEPTTFISASEVSTGVNMDVWKGPDSVPVSVLNDDVMSDPMSFTFTSPVLQSTDTGVGMGGTFHNAPKHDPYSPVGVPELKEHHTIKSAKEEANAKHIEGKK